MLANIVEKGRQRYVRDLTTGPTYIAHRAHLVFWRTTYLPPLRSSRFILQL